MTISIIIGYFNLIIGLSISFAIAFNITTKKLPPTCIFTKSLLIAVAIYISFISVGGYFLDFFSLKLNNINYFIILLSIVSGYFYIVREKSFFAFKHLSIFNCNSIIFFSLLIIILIVLLLPSFPSLFPITPSGDAASHYAMTNHIISNETLLFKGNYLYNTLKQNGFLIYSFGMHINLAMLVKFSGINLIRLIFPFCALFLTFSLLTAREIFMSLDIFKNKNFHLLLSAIPIMLLLSSPYLYSLAFCQFYGVIVSIFLVLIFLQILIYYNQNHSFALLLLLSLIQINIVFTYPLYALTTFTLFLLIHVYNADKNKLRFLTIFLLVTCFIPINYHLKLISWSLSEEGIQILQHVESPVLSLDFKTICQIFMLTLFSMLFLKKLIKELPIIIAAILIISLQILVSHSVKALTIYYINKFYYLLLFPLSVIAGLIFYRIVYYVVIFIKRIRNVNIKKLNIKENIAVFFLLVLLIYDLYVIKKQYLYNRPAITAAQYETALWAKKI